LIQILVRIEFSKKSEIIAAMCRKGKGNSGKAQTRCNYIFMLCITRKGHAA